MSVSREQHIEVLHECYEYDTKSLIQEVILAPSSHRTQLTERLDVEKKVYLADMFQNAYYAKSLMKHTFCASFHIAQRCAGNAGFSLARIRFLYFLYLHSKQVEVGISYNKAT